MYSTHEHQSLYDTTKKFVETELNPHVKEWEEAGIWPAREILKKMGDLGLLGITKPVEASAARPRLFLRLVMAFGSARHRATAAACRWRSACRPTWRRRPWPASAATNCAANSWRHHRRRHAVACLGVSEAGAGSDVASIKTTARKVGDDYVINGGKMWTTNGTQADWMCLLANTSDGGIHTEQVADRRADEDQGRPDRKKLDKLGMRSSDTAQIHLDEVRVPAAPPDRRGGPGFRVPDAAVPGRAAVPVGQHHRGDGKVIADTIEYTRDRKAFGRPLIDNQVIALPPGRADHRGRGAAGAGLSRTAELRRRQGRDHAGLDGQAEGRPAAPAKSPTAACSTGAGRAIMWESGRPFYRDLRLHARSAAAPTRSCCQIISKLHGHSAPIGQPVGARHAVYPGTR
jgi:citronellyl-CoA dehydrogenase